ncbi:MAG TPA: hypothetical protein VFI65_02685 [Streptosporangiaceae bacterium]|nr:hypothetical protein [Streptosporangiaceae bacterium]
MLEPDAGGGSGRGDVPSGDLPLLNGTALAGWRGWTDDVAAVLRRHWRVIAQIMGVTMLLPVLPLSGLIADGVAMGASISPRSKGDIGLLVVTVLFAPFLLALAACCGLVVAQGWTGAARAAVSASSGGPVDWRGAIREAQPGRQLWGSYVIGLVVLAVAAYLAGYVAPGTPTVPDLLVLAGPAGLLAPVLCFAPATTWRRGAPGAADPAVRHSALAGTRHRAWFAPMIFVLAVVVGCEVAVALVLSWLLASAPLAATGAGLDGTNGPVAVVIASLFALPGSVLLVAASSVSYARLPARTPLLRS